jgi:hypothetical protein
MLHELATDRRAPTASNDTHNIRAIGYGSILFGILGASILAMITFLEYIYLLISPWLQTPPCSCCIIRCCSSRISNKRDSRRPLQPGNLSLRNKWNKRNWLCRRSNPMWFKPELKFIPRILPRILPRICSYFWQLLYTSLSTVVVNCPCQPSLSTVLVHHPAGLARAEPVGLRARPPESSVLILVLFRSWTEKNEARPARPKRFGPPKFLDRPARVGLAIFRADRSARPEWPEHIKMR